MKKPVMICSLVFCALSLASCGQPPQVDSVFFPSRSAELLKATTVYGPLSVREGEFFQAAAVKPWSAWWYPFKNKTLWDGSDSPLAKYDQYMARAHSRNTQAAGYERDHFYEYYKNGEGWEGDCNAWAAASLMEDEPKRAVDVEGIHFTIGDLKGLIIKSYENVEGLQFYGQRFYGNLGEDYLDLYPDQFHRLVQAELFEKGRPFIMDKDPKPAVWNTPIFRAQIRVKYDPGNPHVAHVETTLTGVDTVVNSLDAIQPHEVNFEYTYDLKGIRRPDGSFEVKYGEWTGDSINYHPDFLTVLPKTKKHKSDNLELEADHVDEILARSHAQQP